jgi:stearoyl-CoA desaturase (delta-9 desaturase)
MFYGLIDLPWWGYLLVAFVMTHVTTMGVTLYLHRCQAHRGLEMHTAVSHFFRLWLWLSTGMHTKAWTAIHRKHHAKCETDEDPHSPVVLGLNNVLWFGAELYRKESKNAETLERYGQGTPDDWMEQHIYTPYTSYGVFIMLGINLLLFGIPGVAIWAFQMFWIPFTAAGIINGIGHALGYRNFECSDASRNIVPWAIFLCGEELHNNHHTFGTSAKFSVKWWEFDIGWMYITILSAVGLAKAKRVAPKLHVAHEKSGIDLDTVKAIISNRFQVSAEYARDVIKPVLRQQEQTVGIDSNVRKSLLRDKNLIDENSWQSMQKLLANNPALQVVYQFREQLQGIWAKTTATQKELLDALQDWCTRAESAGIESLANFARGIQHYSLPKGA